MMNSIYALISVVIVSIISVIAAIPLFYKKKVSQKLLLFLLSISVGVLLSTVFMTLLPEAMEEGYSLGIAINIFYYVFINTAMVSGLLPVVGVPLPLVSYGGTSMICVMFGLGLVSNSYIFRNEALPRYKDGVLGW